MELLRARTKIKTCVWLFYVFFNICTLQCLSSKSVALMVSEINMSQSEFSESVTPDGFKYMGCYDVWKDTEGTITYLDFLGEMTFVSCAAYCKSKDRPNFPSEILVLRGMSCGCMAWGNFKHSQVQESQCHLKCPNSVSESDSKSKVVFVKEEVELPISCGGNYGLSLYCNKTGSNAKLCDSFEFSPLPLSITELEISNAPKNQESEVEPEVPIIIQGILPVFPCFKCGNPLFDCNIRGFNASFAYFPENTANLCLEFCRRNIPLNSGMTIVREKTTYAIVGWYNAYQVPVPICRCENQMGISFEDVDLENCNTPCPANPQEMCGGDAPHYYSMHCANLVLCSEFGWTTLALSTLTTVKTSEPTTPEVTTEPTTPEVTTEPTTPEVTTEPTTPEVTNEPTSEVTTEPTSEVTTEPTTPEVTTEQTTPELTTPEPTTLETTSEPTTLETTSEPTTLETTSEPTTLESTPETTTPEPTTSEPTTPEPTTSEPTTLESTTVETTPELTTSETTREPTTLETTSEPSTMETTPEGTTKSDYTIPRTPEITTEQTTEETTDTPVITTIAPSPDIKYIGCYDIWKGTDGTFKTTNSFFYKDLNLEKCTAYCRTKHKPDAPSDLFLLRGMYCGCMSWTSFIHFQVEEKYCHLNCASSEGTEMESDYSTSAAALDPNSCGGNYAISFYCDINRTNGQLCQDFKFTPVEITSNASIQNSDSVLETIPPNNRVSKLIDIFTKSVGHKSQSQLALPCFNCTNPIQCNPPIFNTSYAYFPDNSPEFCLNFCKTDLTYGTESDETRIREKTTYAVVGWRDRNLIDVSVCWCINAIFPTFTEVDISVCNKPCPDLNSAKMCGGDPPFIYSMFCANIKICSSDSEPEPPCNLKCSLNNLNGQNWTACAGETANMSCPRGADGRATWKCSEIGEFVGRMPDYSQCLSPWIGDIVIGDDDLLPEDALQIFNKIKSKVKQNYKGTGIDYFGHEISRIMDIVTKVYSKLIKSIELNPFETLTENAVGISENMLMNAQPWEELPMINRSIVGTDLFDLIVNAVFDLTARATASSTEKYRKYFEIQDTGIKLSSGAQLKSVTGDSSLRFPFNTEHDDGSYIILPSGWAQLIPTPNLSFLGSVISSKIVQPIFPLDPNAEIASGIIMNGKLMSFTISMPNSSQNLNSINLPNEGVNIRFRHDTESSKTKIKDLRRRQHDGEEPKPVFGSSKCMYWDTVNLVWSSNGCKLVTSDRSASICECSHLTSFAVLMDLHNYIGKDSALEILTLIICPISVICLILTIIIYTQVRSLQGPITSISSHLCISLLVGNIFILFVTDRHYFNMSDEICTASAIFTHYAFLTAFMWMAIEGKHLYNMVVIVFDAENYPVMIYRLLSYGIPTIIVGVTSAISVLVDGDIREAYGGEMFCWLQGNYIWAFLGPVAIVVLGNSVTLFVTMRIAYKINVSTNQAKERIRSTKKWAKGGFSLTIILGLTWTVGFFMLTGSIVSVIAAYAFTILNSAQGIFIFIFHCLINEKVIGAARRKKFPVPSWLHSRRITPQVSRTKSATKTNMNSPLKMKEMNEETKSHADDDIIPEMPKLGIERRRRSTIYDYTGTVSSLESFKTGITSLSYSSGNESSGSGNGTMIQLMNLPPEELEI